MGHVACLLLDQSDANLCVCVFCSDERLGRARRLVRVDRRSRSLPVPVRPLRPLSRAKCKHPITGRRTRYCADPCLFSRSGAHAAAPSASRDDRRGPVRGARPRRQQARRRRRLGWRVSQHTLSRGDGAHADPRLLSPIPSTRLHRTRLYSAKTGHSLAVLSYHRQSLHALALAPVLPRNIHYDSNTDDSSDTDSDSEEEGAAKATQGKAGRAWLAVGGKDERVSLWEVYPLGRDPVRC